MTGELRGGVPFPSAGSRGVPTFNPTLRTALALVGEGTSAAYLAGRRLRSLPLTGFVGGTALAGASLHCRSADRCSRRHGVALRPPPGADRGLFRSARSYLPASHGVSHRRPLRNPSGGLAGTRCGSQTVGAGCAEPVPRGRLHPPLAFLERVAAESVGGGAGSFRRSQAAPIARHWTLLPGSSVGESGTTGMQ